MKRLCLLLLILLCLPAMAGGGGFLGRFHPGIEWGMSITPASFHHYNYLDESIGFRINDEGWTYDTKLGAFVLGSVAFDITRTFRVGILSGLQGVERNRRIVSLVSRLSFYLSGTDDDGIFVYTDVGLALNEMKKKCNYAQIGSGYRLLLTPSYSLCFRVSSRIVYDRPEVWDPIEEEYISERNIKRNDTWYCALNLGFSLEF